MELILKQGDASIAILYAPNPKKKAPSSANEEDTAPDTDRPTEIDPS